MGNIIFQPESVRQIISGSKTMTRRIVPPKRQLMDLIQGGIGGNILTRRNDKPILESDFIKKYCRFKEGEDYEVKEPYVITPRGTLYKEEFLGSDEISDHKWKTPLFMPSGRVRLVIVVERIRVQRIQDISEMDALLEGCPPEQRDNPVNWFKDLWDSINGKWKPVKRGGIIRHRVSFPWDETSVPRIGKKINSLKYLAHPNPFVFAINFRLLYNDTENQKRETAEIKVV